MKYVIIGGVAAGASAAVRLRRLDEKAEIGNRKGAEAEELKRRQAEARKNGVDPTRKLSHSKKKK